MFPRPVHHKHAGSIFAGGAVKKLLALTLTAVVCLLAFSPATAASRPLSPTGQRVLRVQTPAYQLGSNNLTVAGYAGDNRPGAPALPVWRTLVALPPTGDWSLTYSTAGAQRLAAPGRLAAAPVPDLTRTDTLRLHTDLIDQVGAIATIDKPDPAIYQQDAFYPATPVVVGSEQWQRGQRLLTLRVYPFQYNPVSGELHYHPDLTITITPQPATVPARSQSVDRTAPALNPAATLSNALRIETGAAGLYRIGHADLVAAGLTPEDIDPASLALTYRGQPAALDVRDNGDTSFDPDEVAIFYAEAYDGRFGTRNVYWLTHGATITPTRILTRTVTPSGSEPITTTITRTLHVEQNSVYQSYIVRPPTADRWFDAALAVDVLGATSATRGYNLALTEPITTGGTARLTVALQGILDHAANPDKSIAVALNGQHVVTTTWEGRTHHVVTATVPADLLTPAANQVSLTAATAQLPGVDFYYVAPDWVRLDYPARATATADRLSVVGMAAGQYEVQASGFSTATVLVYDVRDPRTPVQIVSTAATPVSPTWTLSFWDADLPDPAYELSTVAALRPPLAITADTPSAWATTAHAYDYIAIIHSSLAAAAQPLLAHRAAEGLRVAAVDVQDIYDEFSHGLRDPQAIRDFLTYAYHHWNQGEDPPRFVLLVGDGHYDFTGVSGTTLPNLIPPYLIDVDPWLGETAADNRYVSVDGPDDYLPDMAIGRIPANTPAELSAYISKVLAYETTTTGGAWQERVVFVADNQYDPAGNFHALNNEIIQSWLPGYYSTTQIFYNDGVHQSAGAMNTAIKAAFNSDALMLQWFGHASRFRWGSVSMFNILHVPELAANDTWPVTLSYACWAGYFVNLIGNFPTLGEQLVLAPQRGSVADISPSGLHIGDALQILNQGVIKAVTHDRIERFGEAVDAARLYYHANSSAFEDVIDTSVYFGDPALKLRLPDVPLDVALADSAANQQNNTIVVDWQTAHEVGVAGFNVWRSTSPDAPETQLNTNLIPSQASPAPGASSFAYQFVDDSTLAAGTIYYYWIEAVGVTDGWNTLFGPYTAEYNVPLAITLSATGTSPAIRSAQQLILLTLCVLPVGMALGRSRALRLAQSALLPTLKIRPRANRPLRRK